MCCEKEIREFRLAAEAEWEEDRQWHSHAKSLLTTLAAMLQSRQTAFSVHVPRLVWGILLIHTCALLLIAAGLTLIAVR